MSVCRRFFLLTAVLGLGCAKAIDTDLLRTYNGTYELRGASFERARPLSGTLTIRDGKYELDTTLGKCGAQRLKPGRYNERDSTIWATSFSCGRLVMSAVLLNGQIAERATGTYFRTEVIGTTPRCVAFAPDTVGRAARQCVRQVQDSIFSDRSYSYPIQIVRKPVLRSNL